MKRSFCAVPGGHRTAINITVALALGWSISTLGADAQTLGQLAQDEGWRPDHESVPGYTDLAEGIPRDFPVPLSAHDLSASNVAPVVGLEGVTAEQAGPFYREAFARRGWTIHKKVELPGYVNVIACPETGRCVNLSAASPGGFSGPPGLKLRFFEHEAKP